MKSSSILLYGNIISFIAIFLWYLGIIQEPTAALFSYGLTFVGSLLAKIQEKRNERLNSDEDDKVVNIPNEGNGIKQINLFGGENTNRVKNFFSKIFQINIGGGKNINE